MESGCLRSHWRCPANSLWWFHCAVQTQIYRPDRAPEGIELAHFTSISQGLACNLPRHGNDSDFNFKLVPPMVRKSLACSLKILIGRFLAVLGVWSCRDIWCCFSSCSRIDQTNRRIFGWENFGWLIRHGASLWNTSFFCRACVGSRQWIFPDYFIWRHWDIVEPPSRNNVIENDFDHGKSTNEDVSLLLVIRGTAQSRQLKDARKSVMLLKSIPDITSSHEK